MTRCVATSTIGASEVTRPGPGQLYRRLGAPPGRRLRFLLFGGYPGPPKPPRLFCQMLVELGDLKHRALCCVVAHRFGGLAREIGLLKPMFYTLERHSLTMPEHGCEGYTPFAEIL